MILRGIIFTQGMVFRAIVELVLHPDAVDIIERKQVGGILLKRLYQEGEPVKAGQPLFQIPVSDMQAYKQFGNSVAVPVIEAEAKTPLST